MGSALIEEGRGRSFWVSRWVGAVVLWCCGVVVLWCCVVVLWWKVDVTVRGVA